MGALKLLYHPESKPLKIVSCNFKEGAEKKKPFSKSGVNYYPYGKILREYSNGEVERFLTTQHERDKETGLDYRGARFYDSDIARFLSLDPAAAKYPSISPYNYVLGNPIVFIDPNGKDPMDPGRLAFYMKMGAASIEAVAKLDGASQANKFKGIYMIAQYRLENSFNMDDVPGNNPFNIKDKGDDGYVEYWTTEYRNGVPVKEVARFGKFTSMEAGFNGYLSLLKRNFGDAYASFTDDSKTSEDFANGLLNGKNGGYATDPAYAQKMRSMVKGVIADYKQILNNQLAENNGQLTVLYSLANIVINRARSNRGIDPIILEIKGEIRRIEMENKQIEADQKELKQFEINEGYTTE